MKQQFCLMCVSNPGLVKLGTGHRTTPKQWTFCFECVFFTHYAYVYYTLLSVFHSLMLSSCSVAIYYEYTVLYTCVLPQPHKFLFIFVLRDGFLHLCKNKACLELGVRSAPKGFGRHQLHSRISFTPMSTKNNCF